MYLIDTNVISETRKRERANPGVRAFFRQAARDGAALYLSALTVGELQRGVALIRHRGDAVQAALLERWLAHVLEDFGRQVLPVDAEVAQVWGQLRAGRPEHALDKFIAATALIHRLTIVTRNVADFRGTGTMVMNPFSQDK
ncbi:type II toxin-antitoxin system VapC family toxin [Cupriavidus sp. SS-3]|uniref:type II toxin-antitoxin system VapC family toxin n=1 Tax=Cupriavidus sp. SS-3 TaxID=3109596 RepID=UPI002DBCE022|nr:type II toxin-antitoxin system VapC family toxin [Cupriavidus sp. SS-3]MEC3764749.1 type II toxin-antitoxin system VapC family toxin [Cupriavidus sp. SS-3]